MKPKNESQVIEEEVVGPPSLVTSEQVVAADDRWLVQGIREHQPHSYDSAPAPLNSIR